MPKVNPEIIRWARETAGLSIKDASRKLNIADTRTASAVEKLLGYEAGELSPGYTLVENMAKLYHRPLVLFYMAGPPRKGDRGNDYRTLPQSVSPETNAVVDTLIRDVQARQSIIRLFTLSH